MMGLGVISKYRTQLMGIAAILILVCHAPGNNVLMPQFLLRLCEQGQYGVDIFLFLSGVGLSYSMQKANLQKTGMGGHYRWYLKRYKKIFLPYMIIAFPYCFYKYLFEDSSIISLFFNFSTLGYWVNGSGPWFLSLLIWLYLLAPLLYRLILLKHQYLVFTLSLIIMLLCQYPHYDGWMYYTLSAICRIPSFLLGIGIANMIKENKTFEWWWSPFAVFLIILAYVYFPDSYIKWILIIPICYILAVLFSKIGKICCSILTFFGVISLESYLFNIYLGDILNHKSWVILGYDFSYGHYIEYCTVLIIGTAAAYYTNRLKMKIFK